VWRLLQRVFPGFRSARREWRHLRPPHFRLFASSPPQPLIDLPDPDVSRINQASQKYFERSEPREYWLNKPFSDRGQAGWSLYRFGLLLSGLSPGPGDRILDFGCGTGWTSHMLARTGADVVGMDISPAALGLAQENATESGPLPVGASLRFEHFSGERIPTPDEQFDVVVVFDAFHHLPNPQSVVREFHRVLSPHGLLGFAEPGVGHADAGIAKAESGHGILEQDLDVERLFLTARVAGFRDIELYVSGIHPHTFSLTMPQARWFLRGLSWLIPSDYTRLGLLTGPIGILRKGPYRTTSIHPRSHRASIRPTAASTTCPAGARFDLSMEITNPTDTVWLKEGWRGRGCVRVGAHLMDGEKKQLELDYGRADLPHDLPANGSVCVTMHLKAPAAAGHYFVRVDMVNEGICWFEQDGSSAVDVGLDVTVARAS